MRWNKRFAVEWVCRLVAMGLVWGAIAIWRPGILGGFYRSPRAIAAIVIGFCALVALESFLRSRSWPRLGRGVFYALLTAGILAAVIPSFIDKAVHEKESDTFRNAAPPRPSGATADSTSTGPIELGQATLAGIDHRATGTVRVAKSAKGSLAVRFEDLDVEPGPDYFIWLIPGADRQNTDGGVNLGHIKANKGDQEYEAPTDFTADAPVTVLIWCRAFAVPVANATIG